MVSAGLSIGTGFPWIFHLKPEMIFRVVKNKPSVSVFAELNSIVLVSQASYGVSLNFESRSNYVNSIYIGSGDDIFASWGPDDPEEYRKQYMIGWEFKEEYGYNLGYFFNAGLNYIPEPSDVYPKANIGFFFLPGF